MKTDSSYLQVKSSKTLKLLIYPPEYVVIKIPRLTKEKLQISRTMVMTTKTTELPLQPRLLPHDLSGQRAGNEHFWISST